MNGNSQWEWEGNGNKTRQNLGLGMGIGMNHWEWEGMGLKKIFPLISTRNTWLRSGVGVVRSAPHVFELTGCATVTFLVSILSGLVLRVGRDRTEPHLGRTQEVARTLKISLIIRYFVTLNVTKSRHLKNNWVI